MDARTNLLVYRTIYVLTHHPNRTFQELGVASLQTLNHVQSRGPSQELCLLIDSQNNYRVHVLGWMD
jgi:hypothetical protein